MKSLKEKIEVMQAALDGKDIESKWLQEGNIDWFDEDLIVFNWACFDYRIKQEPMEFWVNVYNDGSRFLHDSKQDAHFYNESGVGKKTIKVREIAE